MKQYIDNAGVIYTTESEKVIAYGIRKTNGKINVRLHAVDGNNNLSSPIELTRTQVDNVRELMDYIPIERRDIREIKDILKSSWFTLPCIDESKNLGFQRNKENEITGYMGAGCFDDSGNEIMKDLFSSLPQCRGDAKEIVDCLNPYMEGNAKRQIVLAHALSGAICGMINRNTILSLVGESSTGKTTLQKLGISFFAQSDYSATVLKWSATENALVKRLDGLSGVSVLIDDTQLSKLKQFADIIYSFENGQSKDRMIKGNELGKRAYWAVSIGITAEKSLLDTFSELGSVARMIEMPVYKKDLFDDEKQVGQIQELYRSSYGVVGTTLVQVLLKNFGEESLRDYISELGQQLCAEFEEKVSDNNILKRHLEGSIAIILATAELSNKYLGFSFDTALLKTALFELCEENYRTFDENKFENIIADKVYTEILATARGNFPTYERNNRIVVPSRIMKVLLLSFGEELHVKSARIKEELARQGLLAERNGTYCWNHTIDGKDVTGYELIIKGGERK